MKHGSLTCRIALAALLLASIPPATAAFFGASKNEVAVKVAELPNPDSEVYPFGLAFGLDGSRIAVESYSEKIRKTEAASSKIYIWDWRRQRVEQSVDMPRGFGNGMSTNPLQYSPDGLLLTVCDVSGAGDVIARIWNTATWSIVKDIVAGTGIESRGSCTGAGFTPDGKQYIRAADTNGMPGNNLMAYSVGTWEPIWGLAMKGSSSVSIAISPDGELAAVAGTIFVVPPGLKDPLERAQQMKLAAQVIIVDLRQRKIAKTINVDAMGPLVWSPDGTRLAVAGGSVEMVDPRSGQILANYRIENSTHMNTRFTPDGRYFIECDQNGRGTGLGVKIWDSARHGLLQEIHGNIGSIAVSRDGKYLAVGTAGRTTIWQFK